MDETLKRRLIGALVLVGAAFVLSFWLPQPDGAEGESARDGVAQTSPPPFERIAEPPAADFSDPVGAPPQPDQEGAVMSAIAPPADAGGAGSPPPDTGRAAVRGSAPVTAGGAAAGGWYVQAGSYSEAANAQQVRARIQAMGLPVFIGEVKTPSGLFQRVRSGPFRTREDAERARAKIEQSRIPASVVQDAG